MSEAGRPPTYDGRTGYQPVVALWAEQDMVLADEFRDGNVPAGTGNRRVVEKAVAALPPGVTEIRVRGDSALYEHDLLRWLDGRGIGYGISADLGRELVAAIRALPEAAWREAGEEVQAIRHWAEVAVRAERRGGDQGPAGPTALSRAPGVPYIDRPSAGD